MQNLYWKSGEKMKKGFVSILEMILAVVAIYISFAIFFPGFYHKSGWNDASLVVESKDVILTMDRIGKLYDNSFSGTSLEDFLNESISVENIVYWSEIEGTEKNKIILDCNCTDEQLSLINNWFDQLNLNGRDINLLVCYTNLDKINPCNNPEDLKHTADVLLIWGYKNLEQYKSNLKDFLDQGSGIVEIADFTGASQITSAQTEIFGLAWVGTSTNSPTDDQFNRKPNNASDIIYESYKNFYHIPLPLKAKQNSTTSIPREGGLANCPSSTFTEGNFTLNKTAYYFWICNDSYVYFDTDANRTADKAVGIYSNVTLNKFDFSLRYIDGYNKIGVSFYPEYRFGDFLKYAGGSFHVDPSGSDNQKILINASLGSGQYFHASIVNGTANKKTAWMAEFSDDGYGDDEKLLLLSLLLSTSNKRTVGVLSPNTKIGNAVSYINVKNSDIFEVYRFNLGLGNPYK